MSSKEITIIYQTDGWKNGTLGDVVTFQRGHDLRVNDSVSGPYPVTGSNGIIAYHNAYTTKAPCITVGRSGNSVGTVHYYNKDCWAHNTTLYVKDYRNNEPLFVYYYLKTLPLKNMGGGSAVPTLNRNHIHTIDVCIPNSIFEQRSIAATLSCLDDIIELNKRTNQVLEEMAQAIFKHWFVDFEFPNEDGEPYKSSGGEMVDSELGEIPKGWKVGNIGDYVKIKSGYAFKSSWWTTTGIPVIKIKEIDNYTINFNDTSYVTDDKAKLAKDFKVNSGDLLIAMTGATIGKFAIVPAISPYALVNQRVGKFFLGDSPVERLGFIYCTLKQDSVYSEIVSRGDGSAQPNISPSMIESIRIVLPPSNIINNYNQQVMNLYELIIENISENKLLNNIRDTLLPKLMSGEIRVPVEEVV